MRRIVIVSLLLALAGGFPARAADATTPLTVQLKWTHQAQFAGNYVADRLGYYREEGLDVTFLEGGPGVDPTAAVLSGEADIGIHGADSLLIARSRGKPVVALAVVYQRNPVVFVAKAAKGITRPQQFRGKTIRAPKGHLPSLYAMTSKVGVAPDEYETVVLPSSIDLFASDRADIWGAYLGGLVPTLEQAGFDLSIVFPEDYGVHMYADTVFSRETFIADRPQVVEAFLRATLRGWRHAIANPEEAAAMVRSYAPGADPALETAKLIASVPLIHTGQDPIGWMEMDRWRETAATLRRYDVLTAPVDIPSLVETGPLRAALGRRE